MSSDEDSEQAKSLLQSFKQLGVVPKFKNPDELKQWMADYVKQQAPDVEQKPPLATPSTITSHFKPRISTFSGPKPLTKGDVSYDQWYYEIRCLLSRGNYTKESITEAIQLSLKGEPKEIAVRLGPSADLMVLLEKLKHVYDKVDDEVLLASFYSASQLESEDCTQWAFRLEGIVNKLEQVQSMTPAKKDRMLRTRYYNGLLPALRDVTGHKFDKCTNFEDLWMAVRDIEDKRKKPLTSSVSDETPAVAQVNMVSKRCTEEKDLHSVVQQLISKVDKLEKFNKHQDKFPQTTNDGVPLSSQNQEHFTTFTPTYQYGNNYGGCYRKPEGVRPSYNYGSYTHQQPQQRYQHDRQCYKCGQFGHIAIGCFNTPRTSAPGGRNIRGCLNNRGPMRRGQP